MESSSNPTTFSIPKPCSVEWSDMDNLDAKRRYCRNCASQVHDFTKSSFDEFEEVQSRYGEKVCGIYTTDDTGLIIWSQRMSKQQLIRAFLLAIVFCFNTTLFSFADKNIGIELADFTEQYVATVGGKSTFYVKVLDHKRPVSEVNVVITVNGNISITGMTDKQGRLTFELPDKMMVESIKFEVEGQLATTQEVGTYAYDACKKLYKLKFHHYKMKYRRMAGAMW
jgi:hypothetical protein